MNLKNIYLTASLIFAGIISLSARQADSISTDGRKAFLSRKGELELFAGAELNYRNIKYDKPYYVLLNVAPGMKWHITDHTLLSAQALIPVVNMYGDYYKRPRLNQLCISQEIKLGALALKPSAGLFSMERYGVDLKAMMPVCDFLAFEGQFGYTGFLSMATGWEMSPVSRVVALVGADIWIEPVKTQLRLIGGRFLKDDNGVLAEGMRHFDHTSVGLYAQYSDRAELSRGFNGGFKVIISIPPYGRRHKAVQFRPAGNFRLTNNMNADPRACKVYQTDPEENERHGWFSRDILPWGNNLHNDFLEK